MRGITLLFFLLPIVALVLPIEPGAVFVRVVDSGAGLATVIRMPGDHYIIYDADHLACIGHALNPASSELADVLHTFFLNVMDED